MIVHLRKPRSFTLQWHITERCNWHCKHCYQTDDCSEELTTEQLFNVLEQYLFLIKKWGIPKYCALINVTGGEPFVRKDFFELAEKLGYHSNMFRWGMLSNGSFITKGVAEKLKSFNIDHYQVSLEGAEEQNDEIRGKGSFKRVTNSIKTLAEAGIRTEVSLTLTKKNIKDIPVLVKLLAQLGVHLLGTRRLIPYGRGSELSDILLEPEELRDYYRSVMELNKSLKRKNSKLHVVIGCESGIFNEEIPSHRRKNYCGIIEGRILIVMANGDILPCRRLPIIIGNVLKQSLFEAYYSSDKLWELRNLNNAHQFCQNCNNFKQCFGGAKCVTYCYTSKLFIPDIQCWRFYKKLEKPEFFKRFDEDIKKELELHPVLTVEKNQQI